MRPSSVHVAVFLLCVAAFALAHDGSASASASELDPREADPAASVAMTASRQSRAAKPKHLSKKSSAPSTAPQTPPPTLRPGSKRPPNIILYLSDDLGYGEVNQDSPAWGFPYNLTSGIPIARPADPGRTIRTPNLARLASQGKRLWRLYAPASICTPSRASIFTGRNVGLNKIRTNYSPFLSTYDELNETIPSFAQTLHDQGGYETAYFGKWGLGQSTGVPYRHGFYTFLGHLRQGVQDLGIFQFPEWMNDIETPAQGTPKMTTIRYPSNLRVPPTEALCPVHHSPTCVNDNDQFRARALSYLQARVNSTRPFCLVWASTAPHASGYHRGTKLTSTTARLGDRVGQYPPYACKRGHAAQVEQHIDQDVGLLLDLLEANPYLDENTVVVFASDNGPHAQCTDDVTFNPSFYLGSGGLRGYKHSIWDGGLRVPGIVRWKGKVAAGSVSKVPQSLYDLQHTFLDMAGITPTQTGGSSLVDVWTKGDKAKPVRAWVHLEFCDTPFVDASCSTATLDVADASVSTGRLWKLVVAPWAVQGQLYDLESDPLELVDLSSAFPNEVSRLFVLRNEARVPHVA